MKMSSKKHFYTLKCNRMENDVIGPLEGVDRRFISMGAEGLDVIEGQMRTHFAALPCEVVNTNGSGDALMAGLVHAGPQASVDVAALAGLRCAKITVECPETVNKQLKALYEQIY